MSQIIKELLTTYWNNLLIILGIIIFFIQRHYNLKSKKIETKYALFQSHKINAIIEFYDAFNKISKAWYTFNIYKYLAGEISAKEMDETITSVVQELRIGIFELSMYFNDKEMESIISINQEFSEINEFVHALFFNPSDGERIKIANSFTVLRDKKISASENYLKSIGLQMRKHFKND